MNINMDKKGFINIILVLVAIVVLGIGGYFVLVKKTEQILTPSLSITQTSPVTTQPVSNNEINNWRTYTKGSLTFQYPPDWTAKYFDYAHGAIIENTKGSITIIISEGPYPYGFAGATEVKENPIKIIVDGKEYHTRENIIGNKKAYVDFELGTPQKHHILFGTGYPAGDDIHSSLEDYYALKDTILKILSTIKFL